MEGRKEQGSEGIRKKIGEYERKVEKKRMEEGLRESKIKNYRSKKMQMKNNRSNEMKMKNYRSQRRKYEEIFGRVGKNREEEKEKDVEG